MTLAGPSESCCLCLQWRQEAVKETSYVTILALSGEVLLCRKLSKGGTVTGIRKELARELGFPTEALRLISGGEELLDEQAVQQAELLLTCVLTAPQPTLQAFRHAVRKGQHGYVQSLLSAAGPELRRRFLLDCAAVWDAALCHGLGAAAVLLRAAREEGLLEQCLLQNHMGTTALHCAAAHGQEQVQLLLEAAAGVGCSRRLLLAQRRSDFETALHWAARRGQASAAGVIIQAAAEAGVLPELLMAQSALGDTALHTAVASAQPEVLRLLLRAAEGGGVLRELYVLRSPEGTLREMAGSGGQDSSVAEALRVADPEQLRLD